MDEILGARVLHLNSAVGGGGGTIQVQNGKVQYDVLNYISL